MKPVHLAMLIGAATLVGCRQSMEEQPKLTSYSAAAAFPHNAEARPIPAGVVARGSLDRELTVENPPKVTSALLERGRERFDIFCAPCHGASGRGDGMIVSRGFPKPPSYHEPRLLQASARHYFDVITNGHGVMYPYGARVEPADRWAIIAFIRALQLSQNAQLAALARRSTAR
jgi:mono/diheme cytochrome c family protein